MTFDQFFEAATGHAAGPYGYQCRQACRRTAPGESRTDWLIHIPTGLRKTAAVVLAWLWNRLLPQINNQTSDIRNGLWLCPSPSRIGP